MTQQQQHPYSALTPDFVLDAVEALGYQADARIYPLNSYENRVYQVGLEQVGLEQEGFGQEGLGQQPSLVVKFYRPGRWTREQILEEHQFALELAALELPVVPPVVFPEHGSLPRHGGFDFAVFPQCLGRPPELDVPQNLATMGRFVGRLHAAGCQREFTCRPALTVDGFAVQSRQYLLENDFIPPDLLAAYESLSQQLVGRLQQVFAATGSLTTLRIHGDCHPGNVLWNAGAPNFVDFDDTMTGPAIQDLWMMLSGDRNQRQAQLLELVEGYNGFHQFRVSELALIEALRTMRLMHYSAWLARRWPDPAFPLNFPWFNTPRYWAGHILELREQMAALDEPPLELI